MQYNTLALASADGERARFFCGGGEGERLLRSSSSSSSSRLPFRLPFSVGPSSAFVSSSSSFSSASALLFRLALLPPPPDEPERVRFRPRPLFSSSETTLFYRRPTTIARRSAPLPLPSSSALSSFASSSSFPFLSFFLLLPPSSEPFDFDRLRDRDPLDRELDRLQERTTICGCTVVSFPRESRRQHQATKPKMIKAKDGVGWDRRLALGSAAASTRRPGA